MQLLFFPAKIVPQRAHFGNILGWFHVDYIIYYQCVERSLDWKPVLRKLVPATKNFCSKWIASKLLFSPLLQQKIAEKHQNCYLTSSSSHKTLCILCKGHWTVQYNPLSVQGREFVINLWFSPFSLTGLKWKLVPFRPAALSSLLQKTQGEGKFFLASC